jgi:HSP20 family molecular chaperone IbpA
MTTDILTSGETTGAEEIGRTETDHSWTSHILDSGEMTGAEEVLICSADLLKSKPTKTTKTSDSIKDAAKDFATGVRDKAVDAKDYVKDKARDLKEGVKRGVRDVKEGFRRTGRDLSNKITGDRSSLNRPYYGDYRSYGRNRDFFGGDRNSFFDRDRSSFYGGDRSYDNGYSDLWGNDWSRRDWENRDRSFLDKPYFGIQNLDPWGMFGRTFDYLAGDHISNAFSISKYFKSDFLPFVDVVELDNSFLLYVDVPGMNRDAIKMRLEGNNLVLEGERIMHNEEQDRHISEIRYGKFIRGFSLPDGVNIEALKAKMEDGVLKITIPRDQSKIKHHYLNIE